MKLQDCIQQLEEMLLNLEVRASREQLDKLLADDFFEIGSSGYIFTKADCLEDGVVLTEMTLHHFEMRELADDLVLTTYFNVDKTRNRNTWRSSIWKKKDDVWQMCFHQGTITPQQLHEIEER